MLFKKAFFFILDSFLFIWQLPMNLAGIFCLFFFRPREKRKSGRVTYYHFKIKHGSISLGRFIFLCDAHWGDEDAQKHEYGHFLQGCILGPLALFVIDIPSIVWAGCFGHFRKKYNVSYFDFYTEKWANKITGAYQK